MYGISFQSQPELQESARREWEKVFQQLLHTLRLGVLLCLEQGRLTQQDKDLFFASGISLYVHLCLIMLKGYD